MDNKKDKLMSHEYDGIQEFDNNLPQWWLYGFYFTIVFGIAYVFYYHIFDGPSSQMEYRNEEYAAFVKFKGNNNSNDEMKEISYALLTDQNSLEKGKEIYMGIRNACFTCHGNEGQGLVGPNLTDEYWVNGGDLKSIAESIKNGNIQKGMQPYGMGASVKLNDEQLIQVTSYIISLKGTNPPNPKPVDMTRAKKYEGEY